MKGKSTASLYEVLKAATRTQAPMVVALPPDPKPVLAAEPVNESPGIEERLAAYKARKEAAVEVAPPPPADPGAVLEEISPEEAAEEMFVETAGEGGERPAAPPVVDPGIRVIRMTYNTAAFVALVGVGLLFAAYAVGLKSSGAPVETRGTVAAPEKAPTLYTLHLAEWPFGSARERIDASIAVDKYILAVRRAGHGKPEQVQIKRGEEIRLALYMGTFDDLSDERVLDKLKGIRRLEVDKGYPFAKSAFVQKPK